MKVNKKMGVGRVVKMKKVTARVPSLIYSKAKIVADAQGMTMEEKITDLLRKDLHYVSSQKWFQELIAEQEDDAQIFELFPVQAAKKSSKSKPIAGGDDMPVDDQFGDWNKE
ncbi:hypothetical protein [Delftia lacustris]